MVKRTILLVLLMTLSLTILNAQYLRTLRGTVTCSSCSRVQSGVPVQLLERLNNQPNLWIKIDDCNSGTDGRFAIPNTPKVGYTYGVRVGDRGSILTVTPQNNQNLRLFRGCPGGCAIIGPPIVVPPWCIISGGGDGDE